MLMKKWVKDYLTFTQKDRVGAVVFAAVVLASIFLPRLFSRPPETLALQPDSTLAMVVDTLNARRLAKHDFADNRYESNAFRYENSQTRSFTAGQLFEFDPNTATLADWQRLGLNERTSRTIVKYVSKGGKFYTPEDLLKIWSMPEGFYERVKHYVRVTSVARTYPAYDNKPFVREERKPAVVEINNADTAAFIALPGIGSKLSARIIAFREKLGGFYSVDQIGETWGLPDSTFQKIKTRLHAGGEVKKMSVNTATKDELKAHPYIRWHLANAIVEYRTQHDGFKNLDELKNIVLIDERTFEKIKHYLSL